MMRKSIVVQLLVFAMLLGAGSAQAALLFQAVLTNDQEPVNTPPPQGTSGIAFFTLNDTQTALTYFLDTTGLDFRGIGANGISGVAIPNDDDPNNNVTRIHIHRAPFGVNGGIVFGMIENAANAAATLNDQDDLVVNVADGIITGVWDGTEGNGTTLAAELANLIAGNLYINVHTSDFPGGEIRGQILLAPEPGSLALLACALFGFYVVRRRLQGVQVRR